MTSLPHAKGQVHIGGELPRKVETCPIFDCTYACTAASSWDKWLERFENCLDAIDIGPENIGKGLLWHSTGPKIMLERNTSMYEMHKCALKEHFCVNLNINHEKCWAPSLPENKLL